MENEVVSAVWGFLGALIGGGVSILTTWINNAHGSRLEVRKSRELRIEAARQFQRTTMLSIQDELYETTRIISNIAGHVAAREDHGLDLSAQEAALRQDLNNLTAKLGSLNERVANDALRMKLLEFLVAISKWGLVSTKAEVDQLFEGHGDRLARTQHMLGSVLRSHFESTDLPEEKPWWKFWTE